MPPVRFEQARPHSCTFRTGGHSLPRWHSRSCLLHGTGACRRFQPCTAASISRREPRAICLRTCCPSSRTWPPSAAISADLMFTLRGPEFLVLFAALSVIVFVAVHTWIVARETSLPSDPRVRDPYEIAYLRGDTRELIRVVALSLCIRKLLSIGKTTIQTVNEAEIDRVQLPIEKE